MAYEAAKEEAEDRAEKAEQMVFPFIMQIFLWKKVKTLQKAQQTREFIISNRHQTVTKPYLSSCCQTFFDTNLSNSNKNKVKKFCVGQSQIKDVSTTSVKELVR